MTIQVHIINKDQSRSIEVIQIDRSRDGDHPVVGTPVSIAPGCETSVYVHLLKDFTIREIHPENRD
jgi:hypothetical protein